MQYCDVSLSRIHSVCRLHIYIYTHAHTKRYLPCLFLLPGLGGDSNSNTPLQSRPVVQKTARYFHLFLVSVPASETL